MLKINFFLNGLGLGGTEKTAYLFSKYLDKNNFDIKVFTYKDADLTRAVQFEEFADIILLDRSNCDWSLLEDADIVHSFRSGYPEAPEPGVHFNGPKFIETNVFGQLSNNIQISKTLFMSKSLMDQTIGGMTFYEGHPWRKRFDWINNPIEDKCTDDKFDGLFDKNVIILGRAGRPDNGVYDNINVLSAKLLREQGYDVVFLCLSCPPSMQRDMDKLQIPYHIIETTIDPIIISKFYNTIDIYCEGRPDGHTFGNVLGEAQMHGKPCVVHRAVSKYSGMGVWQAQTEVVKNGETGFVVDYSVTDYADAIAKLVDDEALRIKLGEQAEQHAFQNFHVMNGIRKLQIIYQDVCSLLY